MVNRKIAQKNFEIIKEELENLLNSLKEYSSNEENHFYSRQGFLNKSLESRPYSIYFREFKNKYSVCIGKRITPPSFNLETSNINNKNKKNNNIKIEHIAETNPLNPNLASKLAQKIYEIFIEKYFACEINFKTISERNGNKIKTDKFGNSIITFEII